MAKRTVIGIDPGYADMGWGVIETDGHRSRCLGWGSVKTPAGLPIGRRLEEIYRGLENLLAEYHPSVAAVETIFFQKNAKTAIAVAEARGVIRLCLERNGVPCQEIGPKQVKLAVCGYGAAPKPQIQRMVTTLLALKEIPKPDDAADALAMAIAGGFTSNFETARGR
jgi:crossover junction endodeoxyribonuclease RuvC